MLILLVDNSPEMVMMFQQALEMMGHDVMIGNHGRQALEILEREPLPDLIFSDLAMPQMDGFAFLSHVRQQPEWAHLPFIVVTGRLDEAERAIDHGANDYLLKPFQLDQLERLLDKWGSP